MNRFRLAVPLLLSTLTACTGGDKTSSSSSSSSTGGASSSSSSISGGSSSSSGGVSSSEGGSGSGSGSNSGSSDDGSSSGASASGGVVERGAFLIAEVAPVAFRGVQWATEFRFSEEGQPTWEVVSGPAGATINSRGRVTWTPGESDSGTVLFEVRGTLGTHVASHVFGVTVPTLAEQVRVPVSPDDPDAVVVAVDAPLSPISGAAVTIPPGALGEATAVDVSISSVSGLPAPPTGVAAGNTAAELLPVEFGPSGTVFLEPVQIQLPIPSTMAPNADIQVQTYDTDLGKWVGVPVQAVDRAAGFAVASVQHFTTYVVISGPNLIDLTLALGEAGTPCADSHVIQPVLKDVTYTLTGEFVGSGGIRDETENARFTNLIEPSATIVIADVRFKAVSVQRGAANVKEPEGSLTGVWNKTASLYSAYTSGGRAQFYRGAPTEAVAVSTLRGQAFVTLQANPPAGPWDVYVWVRMHHLRQGPNIITTELSFVQKFEVSGALNRSTLDLNCNNIVDTLDTTPAGTPILTRNPVGPGLIVLTDSDNTLSVSQYNTTATVVWTTNHPDKVLLTPGANGTVVAKPIAEGFYTVTATAGTAPASASESWNILSVGPHTNIAPTVKLATRAGTRTRAGDPATVDCIGKDLDGDPSQLRYAWTVDGAADTSSTTSELTFTPSTEGAHTVTCRATDTSGDTSPAASLTITFSAANLAPTAPTLLPNNVTLDLPAGGDVTRTITATSTDRDGTVASYSVAAVGSTPSGNLAATGTAGQYTFTSTQAGDYVYDVTATDNDNAVSRRTRLTIHVVQLPPAPVDADGDGYPEGTGPGTDCDETNPAIHPGAREICGNAVDENCDGVATTTEDCDADGDGWTAGGGDCLDTDRTVHPLADEPCDNKDNDCDSVTDNGWGTGASCTGRLETCFVPGTIACTQSRDDVYCKPNPEETCNACGSVGTACQSNSDCCTSLECDGSTQMCVETMSCGAVGAVCVNSSDCCVSSFCNASNRCEQNACMDLGGACETVLDCCGSLVCNTQTSQCVTEICQAVDTQCTTTDDCCSGLGCSRTNGLCSNTCGQDAASCAMDMDCCEGFTCNGSTGMCEAATACTESGMPCDPMALENTCCGNICIEPGVCL